MRTGGSVQRRVGDLAHLDLGGRDVPGATASTVTARVAASQRSTTDGVAYEW